MNKKLILLILTLLVSTIGFFSWKQITKRPKNRLSRELSPYLRQHQDNPVWWYAWGNEAFEQAKKQDKPIFLSVGYATCHWCHVMAHESFEDQQVADILNESFIAIKVDREERPDVDAIYMAAVQALVGRGGWPMSVWLTPERKPFYGGTYYPKKQFIEILKNIRSSWSEKRSDIEGSSERLTAHLKSSMVASTSVSSSASSAALNDDILRTFQSSMKGSFDAVDGGFGKAPKFPASMALMALMRVSRRMDDSSLDGLITKTLRKMSAGGIYDHSNGGFHRYSTDKKWLVPHFEKMLYDNALLSMAYIEAFQKYREDDFKLVASETLDYILREMTGKDGAFYSAQDADSLDPSSGHKEEGHFATWSYNELKKLYSAKDFLALGKVFDLTKPGHYEGRNILNLLPEKKFTDRKTVQTQLMKLREQRALKPAPLLDNKIITAWNGLMIASLARASVAFSEVKYLSAAVAAAESIFSNSVDGDFLLRHRIDEKSASKAASKSAIQGFSDDYAAMVHACIELYLASHDEKWAKRAIHWQNRQDELFWDKSSGGYFKSDGSDASIISRNKSSYDGVRPSSNSLAAYNLVRLYSLFYQQELSEKAELIFQIWAAQMKSSPRSLPMMLIALDFFLDHSKEIAIVGKNDDSLTIEMLDIVRKGFSPNQVVALTGSSTSPSFLPLLQGKEKVNGKTTVYVCQNKTCRFPTNDPKLLQKLLRDFKRF